MKGKKITLWVLFILMAVLSVKPFLFTAHFFLYLMDRTGGNTVQAEKHLMDVIRLNPDVYGSLVRTDRADMLLAAAFITGRPELLESLSERDRARMMSRYGNNIFFRTLTGDLSGRIVPGLKSRLTVFLMSDEAYSGRVMSALKRMGRQEFLAHSAAMDEYLGGTGNRQLRRRIREYSRELKQRTNRAGSGECP